jgi:hypothetical protein
MLRLLLSVFQRLKDMTVLTTRPKGIARDIKLNIGAVVNTYQQDRCDARSSQRTGLINAKVIPPLTFSG